MLLSEMLKRLSSHVIPSSDFSDCEIVGITENSNEVKSGFIFVALRGLVRDGNDYIEEAAERGAVCIVTEKCLEDKSIKNAIICKNARKTMAELSKILYGDPSGRMKIVGITGTKGKTTTAEFLRECLAYSGIKCFSVGTLGVRGLPFDNERSKNTTPSSAVLFRTLARGAELGAEVAILEVSSQALVDFRVYGIAFDIVIYTGFSFDHIGRGEHKNMREYFLAKRRLFTDYSAKCAIVYDDGEYSRKISYGVSRIIRCGENMYDEYYISDIFITSPGVGFTIDGCDFSIGLEGKFNVINATLAMAAAKEISGNEIKKYRGILPSVRVRGRFEMYELDGKHIIIDFAHNADSIRNMCISVRKLSLGRIILLFGSVGGRAEERRREMAVTAEEFADFSIITSDNPGNEPAENICRDIRSYYRDKSKSRIIIDRRAAIIHALELAERGDYVLLLGKGHEEEQLVGTAYIPFSERDIISSLGAVPLP